MTLKGKKNHYNVKFLEDLSFNLGISENVAHISFATKDTRQSDFEKMFVSYDRRFRRWCEDLFDQYWNDVQGITRFDLTER